MKLITQLFFIVLALVMVRSTAVAQCTSAPNGQWPLGTVTLNNNATPKVLATNCYCGEYTVCSNVQNAKSYTVTSSVPTDYITITDATGLTPLFFGTQPLVFTAPSAANIRVYRHLSSACEEESVDRSITVTCTDCGAAPPPPANDDPCGAISLTVSPTCAFSEYTNADATGTSGPPLPGCAVYNGADVWFSFVVPAGGAVILDSEEGDITDSGMAIYSSSDNTCTGTFSVIECDDDDSANGAMSSITRTGLTPGNTIFVRFWAYNNSESGTFSICATVPAGPPANDLCAGAVAVTNGSSVTLDVANATDDATAPTCNFISLATKGVWYVYNVPANTSGTVTIDGCNTNYDARVRVYTGTCAALVCVTGDDDDDCAGPGSGLAESTTFTVTENGAAVDYYILITGSGNSLDFSISSVLPIELTSFSGKAMDQSNMLTWTTSTEKNVEWHIIERSVDGSSNWTEIGKKTGRGTTQLEQKYDLEDKSPLPKAYYRIRTVDFDGGEQVSNTISISRNDQRFGITAAYPNPASDLLNIQLNTLEEETVTIQIIDFTGRLVLQQKTEAAKGANLFPVNLGQLSAGAYTVNVFNGNAVAEPLRFVKQ